MPDVIITVKRKKRDSGKGKPRRKGVVTQNRNRQDLGRRRVKKKGLVNFYELGLVRDGSNWVDRPLYTIPGLSSAVGDFPVVLDYMYDADWQSVRDALLAITNRKTNARRIEYARADLFDFYISVNGTDNYPVKTTEPLWTEEGFASPTAISRIQIGNSGRSIYGFQTDESITKITELPTFTAPTVVPTFGTNVDVFFAPYMYGVAGESNTASGFSGDVMGGGWYAPIPNDVFEDAAGEGTFSALRTRIIGDGKYRGWTKTTSSTVSTGGTIETVPPAVSAYAAFIGAHSNGIRMNSQELPDGMLLAIIETGSRVYYVWDDSGTFARFALGIGGTA